MSQESGAVTAKDFFEGSVAAVACGMTRFADIGPVSGRPLTPLIWVHMETRLTAETWYG
jgi:hypothetical protein